MSLFEYDARPATPQVILAGRASPVAYAIRDFLSRNQRPFQWRDVDQSGATLPDGSAIDLEHLPLCVLPDGTRLTDATVEGVAAGLGMILPPAFDEYDLCVIGAGPAGLAASVYAASEGLRTVVVESLAPGGQAGTTSLIENLLGFPRGISGSELANSATLQARKFGAEILLARPVDGVTRVDGRYVVELSDGVRIPTSTVLVATGVEWRRLDVPGIDDLLGAGVFYGAGPSEARACVGGRVMIVGGGNSAGQAAVRFSQYAGKVTLLARSDLSKSMSRYLIDHVSSIDNVEVRTGYQVAGVDASGVLRAVDVVATDGSSERVPVDGLFLCIGGTPRNYGAKKAGVVTDAAGYLLTGNALTDGSASLEGWPLSRQPLPLETNFPGIFAAGDVRSGSTKRCAAAIGEGAMSIALVHQHLAEVGA